MANGFAMRGFTQGLTQGLQNANDLYNSSVNRDLQRAESERLRKGQETQDRWYEAQAKNMELDNNRQERQLRMNEEKGGLEIAKERLAMEQANKQAQFPVIEAILKKDSINEDDYRQLVDFGMAPMLNMEDDADTINNLAKGVRSGQIPIDDPEVAKRLLPALTPVFNRNLGDVGRDPKTGAEIRVAVKEPVGFHRVNGKVVPMLRVKGANAKGEFAEYDAPATQFASSLPDDPLLALTESEAARKLTGLAKFNRMLSRNPTIRQQAQEFSRSLAYGAPKPISARDEAYINNQNALTAKNQLEALQKRLEIGDYGSKSELERQIKQAELNLKMAQSDTELSKQDKNWAEADSKGLGSVSKNSGSGGGFDIKRAESVANQYFPIPDEPKTPPANDPLGEKYRAGKEELLAQRQKYIRTVQGLVTVGGIPQEKAELAASTGEQELFAAKDGHTYWVVNTFDEKGNPIKVAFSQVK
jgi:hypothetical protein